jgi:hypothetical protein
MNDQKNAQERQLADDTVGISGWIKKNANTAALIVTAMGVLGAWVGLIILGIQSCALQEQTRSVQEQTRLAQEQTEILQSDYEARNRPYLAIGNITTSEGNGSWVEVRMDVINCGLAPATHVYPLGVFVGGKSVTYDESTGTYTFGYMGKCDESSPKTQITDEKTGVTISVCGAYVTALTDRANHPSDLLFFPRMPQSLTAVFDDRLIYEATVSDTRVMNAALTYSWGTKSYYCLAMATMEDDGSWVVRQQRGD